jgi:hypothetical protein
MASQVQGIVAMDKGEPVSLVTIVVPDPGRVRPSSPSRRAVSAIPICTTARAGSTTSFRSFSDTRLRASSRKSDLTSLRSSRAISSC